MKKAISLCLLFAFATTSFSQQIVQKQSSTQTDYLNKSKHQKATGWVLLAGGTVVLAITAAASAGIDFYHKKSFPIVPVCIGGAMMAGSIPLFIASGRNKRKAKAASAFLNMEKFPVLQRASVINQSFPVIGLRIKI
jgi:hypothetical protein